MAVIDSINKARSMGASSDAILNELQKQNPNKAAVISKARSMGATPDAILDEMVKQNPPKNILQKTGDFFNKLDQSPLAKVVKLPGQMIAKFGGALVGAAGAGISAATEAVGTPLVQAKRVLVDGQAPEKPSETFNRIFKGAKSGYQFGSNVGEQGVAAAPLAGAGRIPTAVLSAGQAMQGVKNIKTGLQNKDAAQTVEGGLQLGTSLFGLRSAVTEPGLVVNRGLTESAIPELAAKRETVASGKASKLMDEVIQTGKQRLRDQQKADIYGITPKNPGLVAAKEGVVLHEGPNKSLDTTSAIKDNLLPKANQIHQEIVGQLQNTKPVHSLSSISDSVISDIKTRKGLAASERKSMIAEVMKQVDDEREHYGTLRAQEKGIDPSTLSPDELRGMGDKLTDQELELFKEGMWSMGYDASKPVKNASEVRRLGSKARELLVQSNKDKNLQKAFQQEAGIRNLISILESVQGNKIRGGLLGKRVNQATAALMGTMASGGNPIAGMAASEAAGRATDLLVSPTRRSAAATKVYQKGVRDLTPSNASMLLKVAGGGLSGYQP